VARISTVGGLSVTAACSRLAWAFHDVWDDFPVPD
jgi:hypothetical protein